MPAMRAVLRFCVAVLAVAYVVALSLWAAGTFGLFGADRDPLAAILLVALAFPWSLLIGQAPDGIAPWLIAVAPLGTIAALLALAR